MPILVEIIDSTKPESVVTPLTQDELQILIDDIAQDVMDEYKDLSALVREYTNDAIRSHAYDNDGDTTALRDACLNAFTQSDYSRHVWQSWLVEQIEEIVNAKLNTF